MVQWSVMYVLASSRRSPVTCVRSASCACAMDEVKAQVATNAAIDVLRFMSNALTVLLSDWIDTDGQRAVALRNP